MDVYQVGIIYYTHGKADKIILNAVRKQIMTVNLPIVSVSLQPLDFGKNIVLQLEPSIITYYTQIYTALLNSETESIFFCEHDVLYHPSHFDFRPERKDTYYYNNNVWRWKYPHHFFITYNEYAGVSGMCANRELLINHYHTRLMEIKRLNLPNGANPYWARRWGHEPGKPRRSGGILDERTEKWRSVYPNIDIRHKDCLTPIKMTMDSFKHKPTGWREATEIPGWNLEKLFPNENR